MNRKVKNLACSMLLLPLEKLRMEIEEKICDFTELVKLNDPKEFVDTSVQ